MRDSARRRTSATGRCLRWVGLACLCLFGLHQGARAQAGFQLQSAKGRVEMRRGQGPWVPVRRGLQTALPGDRVRTGPNSAVYLVTSAGQRVAFGPNTEVILSEPKKPSGWRVVVGRVLAVLTGRGRLEVRAPGAVAAAEGTTFQVEAAEDGTTVLTVVEGLVHFYNELGSVDVVGSQQSTARLGSAPTRPAVIDPSGMVAWEASLQTLIIEPECPQVGTDPAQLDQELTRRQEALRERPDDPAAHAGVAAVLLDLGRADEALPEAQRAAELAPGDAGVQTLLGFALLRSGRPAEAGDAFAQAAKAQPAEARPQLGLGLVALGQRDSRPAVALLQRAAELSPTDPAPQAYLAAADLRLGDAAGADAAAATAVRLGPGNYLANTYLAYVRLAQGNLEEAIAAGAKAVQAAPGSALAHEALATARFFAGQFREAREELSQALKANPLSASEHLTLAKIMAAEDQIDVALDEAELAVSLNPQSAPAHSALGLLFLLNNDPQRAGREFGKALTFDPSLAEAHTGWGVVLARRGRFKEALDEQKAALSLDTNSASAENNLGGVAASLGHMKEAIEHLNRAIELQPGWGVPYANLAVVHLEQNQYREALDAGTKAVKLGERSAFTHTVLARIYVRQGRFDRALAELQQAVALDRDYPQARYQLARLYLQQGRSRDAVRDILTSLTTDPSAMLETRRYARTEATLSGGNYGTVHLDARHGDSAADGRLSYYVSGLIEHSDHWRVNQESTEAFGEVIAGYQPTDTKQLVVWGTGYSERAGLPGPRTGAAPGDPDDRASFPSGDVVVAYRQRLTPHLSATAKYAHRRTVLDGHNPDALTGVDTSPFQRVKVTDSEDIPEVRLDAEVSKHYSVRGGYAHSWSLERSSGVAGAVDPGTGAVVFTPFSDHLSPETDTAWVEGDARVSDHLHLTVGGYLGGQSGSPTVALPKAVALYRPDKATWVSLMAIPIVRNDACELAPVEPLADPAGLQYLSFVEGGAGRSYELRFQRETSHSASITASAAYQRVRGLLVDVQDPSAAFLPARVLVARGSRWFTGASYEQWLTGWLTGRAWVRYQDTSGVFPAFSISGTEWPYTPHWQGGARLDYLARNGLRIGLAGTWVGDRFHDPANAQQVAGYALLGLSARYQRNLHEDYFLEIGNLTGTRYVTYRGFPQAEQTVAAGVDYRF